MPNLGERIYRLRTQNNMSQDMLADALNVSRQAVSKWENNISVPDLDKIAALSSLFSVTTDELIKGEIQPTANEPAEKETVIIQNTDSGFSKRKITQILGIVFIILGFISAVLVLILTWELWLAALLALLVVDGIVLLVAHKRPWLMFCITNLIILFLITAGFSIMLPKPQPPISEVEEIHSVEPDVSIAVQEDGLQL